ncbi:S8 family peptidase [Saccharothrix deserti]|uniref:S8 family peptidase n=1 Tax=Saccharothrix deserti TaxID=2593674 RepID=UPI00131CA914|nr:S8 family peptidase [Saccharothrix deserti]
MSRRTTALFAVGLVTAAAMTAVTGSGTAAPPTGQGAEGPDGTVTLLTGDRVTLRAGRAEVRPGSGRGSVRFFQHRDEQGDLHVVPADAAPAVRSGQLDERLFDVTGLIRAGYDDRSSAVTPLIVTSTGPAIAGGQALPSIGGFAVEAAKDTAFWSGARAAGSDRVWLDGPVSATLDRSVPQVGAPEAWQAGHTGSGTKVAVLDTGIDDTHPDLAGSVVEARNFSDSDTTDDRLGHGTHVAATITGSGRYQGVAPDSALLVGKVLGDHGGGRESDIIAGMEWAVYAGADVVNLSLGSPRTSDGSDPMSQAVNRLTEQSGALFVVAAGNSGPDDQTIGSPAAADAALTVGAVDRSDNLAGFSSRGPRRQDNAIKPDITAPGVDIVAARAKNGTMGTPAGDGHVALSGTSMATPHVAGAAAILAGQHPDWTAAQLKSALMGSAKPNPALSVYEQGAGRVDVARAAGQSVSASPASLNLGIALWPHHDDAPIVKEVTYRNSGTTPLTLEITDDLRDPAGNPAPSDMVAVSPSSVTIAPGGSTSVTVTTKTSVEAPDGPYGGALVATGGTTAMRTPIGVTKEVESYDVKLTFLDHDGKPTPNYSYRLDEIVQPKSHARYDSSGTVVTRLPKGVFYLGALVETRGQGSVTHFLEPSLTVTGAAELVFDARQGRPLTVRVDQPDAKAGYADLFFTRKTTWGDTGNGIISTSLDGLLFVPSKTSAPGAASFTAAARLAKPDTDGTFVGSPYQYNVSWTHDGAVPEQLDRSFADRDLVKVNSVSAAAAPGKTGFRDNMAGGPLPLRITEFYTPDTEWYGGFTQMTAPYAYPQETFQYSVKPRRFQPGRPATEKWNAAVFGPAFPLTERPYEWAARRGDTVGVSVPMFTDQDSNHYGYSATVKAQTTLHRDGKMLAGTWEEAGYLDSPVPADKGTYTLNAKATRTGVADLSSFVMAEWTFTSEHVAGDEPAPLPLLAVRFAPSLDDENRAEAGRPFAFPVYVQRNGVAGAQGVATPAVQVSYDEGATWKPVPLVKVGERWIAAVAHPADAKFVSLKAQARDAEGNSVDQTILKAYALK